MTQFRRILITLLATAASCAADGTVDYFLGVQNWHGTIKITGTGSGSSKGGPYSDIWQYGVTSSINIQLDTYDPRIQGWTGTFKGTSNINASDVSSFPNCDETFSQSFMGVVGAGKTFTMILEGDNKYRFYPSDYQVQGATSTVKISCAPGTMSNEGPANWSPVLSDKVQTLPATGFVLKGSQTAKMNSPDQPQSLVFGGDPAIIDVTIEWDIEPGLDTPAEVVVMKTSDLGNWRPTAGAKGKRGNSVDLIAKLQAKGGGETNVEVGYWTWELTKCSKEPGYAMNAEIDSPNSNFDLKFESGSDGLKILDDTGQKAQSEPAQTKQSMITLASYDWGAFGTVKVTAYLPDGSTLIGYLEGDPSQTDVRVPLRSESSLIADAWKHQHPEIDGLADITDNETDPTGDGTPGDGFTLYEEYRGFIIDGQHVEGNPTKKDYFIQNNAGQTYQSGFKLFQQLSGLEVHYNVRKNEMPADRVMNHNHTEGAHLVDQHGVFVVPIAANAGYAEAFGGPGTPKSITSIVTPTILPGATDLRVSYLASSLAHELLHACNVYHHGDAPSYSIDLFRLSNDDILAGGAITTVLTEQGSSAAPLLAIDHRTTVILGVLNDTHTGNDDCVMRYDDAQGYISKADPRIIYYAPGETAGGSICTSGQGTGINDSGRTPQARYGDAASGRGNCRGQILVNDAAGAPKR